MRYCILVQQNDYLVAQMKKNLAAYQDEVKEVVESYFLPVFERKIQEKVVFIEAFDDALKKLMGNNYLLMSKEEALHHFSTYKNTVEKLVEEHLKNGEINGFDKEFTEFNTNLVVFVESIDEVIVEDQSIERFAAQDSDTFLTKVGKWFKRFFRKLSGFPLWFANGFRKLFRKPIKERKAATHKIRLRNLARFYFKEHLSKQLAELADDFYKTVSLTSQEIWQIDEQIDHVIDNFINEGEDISLAVELTGKIPEAIKQLESCKNTIAQKSVEHVESVNKLFVEASTKVGTFELSNRRFRPSKSASLHYKLNQAYAKRVKCWNNTLLILSDDWEIDLELYATIYTGLEAYYANAKEIENRLSKNIKSEVLQIIAEIEKCKKAITEAKTRKSLEKILEEQLDSINTSVENKLIPQANEVILTQDLPALINNIEASLNKEVHELSDKRAMVKGAQYDEPVRTAALNYITPRELINFESWPLFQKATQACKVSITARINTLQQDLSQIGQIAAFNLESALSIIRDKDSENDPAAVALEGMNRTVKKAEALVDDNQEIVNAVEGELLTSLQKFNSSLEQFTNNENIYEIRVRIAKAKAIERSKRLRKEWIRRVKNLLPIVWNFINVNYSTARNKISSFLYKYGLSKAETSISTEIADFLAETELAIAKLPFVYQRLFRSVPLQDGHLFEGRKTELNELNNAYNNFMRGRFAATMVVGEKGAGITTLLNFFSMELSTSCELIRLDLTDSIKSNEELTAYFSDHFKKKFGNLDEVKDFLNSGKKKVVIIENTQKLYLKKVSGFEAIASFFELISLTNKKVFWLTTCTVYAWNYLDKTIKVSDHFGYKVEMHQFEDEVITKIISKRHQVSGYNLQFEPATSHLNSKKFKKLGDKEKQNQLRQEYFNDLNRIAKSNIGLALVYWLRSTSEVSDNTIYIDSLKDLDFGFMSSLPLDKLHALYYLLLHDGLTEEDFCTCFGKGRAASRAVIYPMYEDGILVEKEDQYIINPLLYRQSVALLKTKNIIH